MSEVFHWVVSPGSRQLWEGSQNRRVFVQIMWDGRRLSLSGVEGPKANGDAFGDCGQIQPLKLFGWRFNNGWNPDKVSVLNQIWDRWHLNDMRAGSPGQMEWLRSHPITVRYPDSHYVVASKLLAKAGLNPDPHFRNYKYGSEWLFEEVPTGVVDWLASLPEAPYPYPWSERSEKRPSTVGAS